MIKYTILIEQIKPGVAQVTINVEPKHEETDKFTPSENSMANIISKHLKLAIDEGSGTKISGTPFS
jgi:hypothetical protein